MNQDRTKRSAPRVSSRWRVGLAATLVASAAVFGAAQTAQAEPLDVEGGTIEWGVRTVFRSYVAGPIPNNGYAIPSAITPSDGATQNPPAVIWSGQGSSFSGGGAFTFPVTGGSYDADTGTTSVDSDGAVQFFGHGGELNLTVSNVRVVIDGADAHVVADLRSLELGATDPDVFADVELVELDLSGVTPTVDGDMVTYAGVPSVLTDDGADAFAGFYGPGEAFDPVTFTLALGDAPAPPPPPAIGELQWRFSAQAQTASPSISQLHEVEAPAQLLNAGDLATRTFSFPATSASYDPSTGATVVTFSGTATVGNTSAGNYRLGIVDPRIVIDATGHGELRAHGIYGLAPEAGEERLWTTSLDELTIFEFTVDPTAVDDTGSSVSATYTATPWLLVEPIPSPTASFHSDYVDFLDPSLQGWVRATSTTATQAQKQPAPLHVEFDYTPPVTGGSSDAVDIITDVEAGALVISVTNDQVVLPTPTLNPAGSALQTSGPLGGVRVVDTRSTNPGWQVNAQVTDFAGPGGAVLSGNNLGWTPSVVATSASQTVTPGAPAGPGTGLGGRQLATASAGAGVGTADLDAMLELVLPTDAAPGTYEATLTLTAI